jgi:hypothetical protein
MIDLLVEYELDPQGCTITLFIRDVSSNNKQQMGWWDLVRWHPYCLHPEELDIFARLTQIEKQEQHLLDPPECRQVADFRSERWPASNRNGWPASIWNAWPASSESADRGRSPTPAVGREHRKSSPNRCLVWDQSWVIREATPG